MKPISSLKHRFDPLTEAWLANVMHRYRATCTRDIADILYVIKTQGEHASGNLEQRIVACLRQFFFRSAQLSCQLELLFLEGVELGVVSEETVLRLENLIIQTGNDGSKLVVIPESDSSTPNISGGRESAVSSS